jgi:hypothetical protein
MPSSGFPRKRILDDLFSLIPYFILPSGGPSEKACILFSIPVKGAERTFYGNVDPAIEPLVVAQLT